MTGPAPYSNRDEEETLAIDTFKILVDHKQIKLDIKERDKYPNIDGYIEIVDEERRVIGKLEAQVKKLPDNCGTSPKLPCPISLFDYARITTNPVLLIGVDVNQKKAYWAPITEDLIRDKEIRKEQQTITISFHLGRAVNDKDTRYVIEWLRIAQDYQTKLREYDRLLETLERLSKNTTFTVASVTSPGFREIHEFLDEMNALLDGPFSLVKSRFYPGSWKVGLAYRDFTHNSVTYTLYPIRPEENEAQIKEIDTRQDLLSIDGIRGYFTENPIRIRPKQHAMELIEESMTRIFKGKLLSHHGSEALAREFIFALVDRFAEQMGLMPKDDYKLTEIETAFYYHLPIWVEEAVRLMIREERNGVKSFADCLYRKPYFNPDMLRAQIMPEEMKTLEMSVTDRMKRGDPVPKIPVGYEKLPLGLFEDYHSFLISSGVKEVHRMYEPPDYSRIQRGGNMWDAYSPENVQRNLETLFASLLPAYSGIVEQNFPQMKRDLLPFGGATRVIVFFDAKDRNGSIPSIDFCYLKCKGESGPRIDLSKAGQYKELETMLKGAHLERAIELDGKSYEFIEGSLGVMDFRYDELPLLDFVYEQLERAVHRYLTELKESKA